MPNEMRNRVADFCFLLALAASANGCAMSADTTEATNGAADEAALRGGPGPLLPPRVEHHHICYETDPGLNSSGTVVQDRVKLLCRANDGPCVINPGTPDENLP